MKFFFYIIISKKEFDVSLSIAKHKFKEEIKKKKNSVPFDIKQKKCTFNKISQEMGFICPEYNTIKSQISRNKKKKNKQLPHDVKLLMKSRINQNILQRKEMKVL